jgi:hypothetical protein
MKCTRLLKSLDEMIVDELLHPENASSFYVDSIRFESKLLGEASELLLQQHIDAILATEKGTSFLLSLPFEKMHSLCSKSSLCVTDEKELVTLFTKYLEHREVIRPLLPEEDPAQDCWSHLTEEEKAKRETDKKEEEAKATAAKEEEAKAR